MRLKKILGIICGLVRSLTESRLTRRPIGPPDFSHEPGWWRFQSSPRLQLVLALAKPSDSGQARLGLTQHRQPGPSGETAQVSAWPGRSVQGVEAGRPTICQFWVSKQRFVNVHSEPHRTRQVPAASPLASVPVSTTVFSPH